MRRKGVTDRLPYGKGTRWCICGNEKTREASLCIVCYNTYIALRVQNNWDTGYYEELQYDECPTYNENPGCKGRKLKRAEYCRSCATKKNPPHKRGIRHASRHVSARFLGEGATYTTKRYMGGHE